MCVLLLLCPLLASLPDSSHSWSLFRFLSLLPFCPINFGDHMTRFALRGALPLSQLSWGAPCAQFSRYILLQLNLSVMSPPPTPPPKSQNIPAISGHNKFRHIASPGALPGLYLHSWILGKADHVHFTLERGIWAPFDSLVRSKYLCVEKPAVPGVLRFRVSAY
jgi:hypothetical protein